MNRSGAAIVAAEGIIVAVEFARRARLQKILNRALLNARREQGDRRVSEGKESKPSALWRSRPKGLSFTY
jgi:hypothetical protein